MVRPFFDMSCSHLPRSLGVFCWIAVLLGLALVRVPLVCALEDDAAKAEMQRLHGRGMAAYTGGDFSDCITAWTDAVATAKRAGLQREEVYILVNLAQAYHSMGNLALAYHALNDAEQVARHLKDENLLLKLRGVRGALGVFGDDPLPEKNLRDETRKGDRRSAGWTWAESLIGKDGTLWAEYLEPDPSKFPQPKFPKPLPEQWAAAEKYFEKDTIQGVLRTANDDLTNEALIRDLESANHFAVGKRFTEAEDRLREAKAFKYHSHLGEIARLYGLLASNLKKGGLKNYCAISAKLVTDLERAKKEFAEPGDPAASEEVMRMAKATAYQLQLKGLVERLEDLSNDLALNREKELARSCSDSAVILQSLQEQPVAMLVASRSTSNWRTLLEDSGAFGLNQEDHDMMRILARDQLPRLIDYSRQFLVESGTRLPGEADAKKGFEALETADLLAESLLDPALALEVKKVHGALLAFGGSPELARIKPEQDLLAAWAAAKHAREEAHKEGRSDRHYAGREAAALNDLGVSISARGKDRVAAPLFRPGGRLRQGFFR